LHHTPLQGKRNAMSTGNYQSSNDKNGLKTQAITFQTFIKQGFRKNFNFVIMKNCTKLTLLAVLFQQI